MDWWENAVANHCFTQRFTCSLHPVRGPNQTGKSDPRCWRIYQHSPRKCTSCVRRYASTIWEWLEIQLAPNHSNETILVLKPTVLGIPHFQIPISIIEKQRIVVGSSTSLHVVHVDSNLAQPVTSHWIVGLQPIDTIVITSHWERGCNPAAHYVCC